VAQELAIGIVAPSKLPAECPPPVGLRPHEFDQLFSASTVIVNGADDIALVEQCLSGDTDAFGALVDRYQQAVFNVALRMVNRYEDAQDIAQTVFLKAYRNLGSYKAEYKFFSWIYRMVVNESINFLERRRSTELLEDIHVSSEPDPHVSLETAELNRSLERAIASLLPEYRAVIILRHFEDLSYDEIARILRIPEKTVKSRLFSARRQLREALIEHQGSQP